MCRKLWSNRPTTQCLARVIYGACAALRTDARSPILSAARAMESDGAAPEAQDADAGDAPLDAPRSRGVSLFERLDDALPGTAKSSTMKPRRGLVGFNCVPSVDLSRVNKR